jgi:hypothetical protein
MTEKQLKLLNRVAEGKLVLLKSDVLVWHLEDDTICVDPDERRTLHELWRDGFIRLYDNRGGDPLPSDPDRQDRVVEVTCMATSVVWECRVFGYPKAELKPDSRSYAEEIMRLCWFRRGGVLTLDEIMDILVDADLASVKKALHWLIAPPGPLVKVHEKPRENLAGDNSELNTYGLRNLQVRYLYSGNADEDILRRCYLQEWDPDRQLEALSSLEALAASRQRDNVLHGWEEFPTDRVYKRILVLIDNPEKIFPLAPQRFAELIRRSRKLGICFHVRTDDATFLDNATYGGCDSLRECVTSYSRK